MDKFQILPKSLSKIFSGQEITPGVDSMFILNLIASILFFKFAMDSFAEERNVVGYMDLFISALNAAAVAHVLL
jgi:hypothetical protein